jgi:esterase/lipase superfamily enzyme
MFVEVDLTHFSSGLANEYLIQLYQDAGARILVFRTAANELNYYFLKGGVAFFSTTSVTANGRHKLAFGYKSGDSAFYIDGVQQHTSSTAFTAFASLTELQIAANFNPTQAEIGDYSYAQALLFKTRLTNAQLAELTSL